MQGKSYKVWFPLLVVFNLLAAGSFLRAQELMTQQVRPSTSAFALDTLPVDDVIATNLRFAWLQSANAGLYLVYNEVDQSVLGAPRRDAQQFIIKYSRIRNIFN